MSISVEDRVESIRSFLLRELNHAEAVLTRFSAECLTDPTYAFGSTSSPHRRAWERETALVWLQALNRQPLEGFVAFWRDSERSVVVAAAQLQPSDERAIVRTSTLAYYVEQTRRNVDALRETK